jgi:hypothetical protein
VAAGSSAQVQPLPWALFDRFRVGGDTPDDSGHGAELPKSRVGRIPAVQPCSRLSTLVANAPADDVCLLTVVGRVCYTRHTWVLSRTVVVNRSASRLTVSAERWACHRCPSAFESVKTVLEAAVV